MEQHYSWLPTRAYREAFGLLTYRDALPAFQPACAFGDRSVCVQRLSGARVWVPAHLVQSGSCYVTAACHGRAESYEIYHHPYEAFAQHKQGVPQPPSPEMRSLHLAAGAAASPVGGGGGASGAGPSSPWPYGGGFGGSLGGGEGAAAAAGEEPPLRHSYSYLTKEDQKLHFRSLPPEVLRDFEDLFAFQSGGLDHTVDAQCALIQRLFPRLSPKQVAKLQDRRVWGSPWQPGASYLGGPNVVVTAQKAREWQRMFDAAAAFCEEIYGEKINMDGVKPCTMTCLALETLPLPAYDLMNT